MSKLWVLIALAALAGCGSDENKRESTLTWEQTPLSVRKGIEKQFPEARINKIEREENTETKVVQYEVELVTNEGKEREARFAPDGEYLDKK